MLWLVVMFVVGSISPRLVRLTWFVGVRRIVQTLWLSGIFVVVQVRDWLKNVLVVLLTAVLGAVGVLIGLEVDR